MSSRDSLFSRPNQTSALLSPTTVTAGLSELGDVVVFSSEVQPKATSPCQVPTPPVLSHVLRSRTHSARRHARSSASPPPAPSRPPAPAPVESSRDATARVRGQLGLISERHGDFLQLINCPTGMENSLTISFFAEPDTFLMFADADRIVDAPIEPDVKASAPLKEAFPSIDGLQVFDVDVNLRQFPCSSR